MSPFFQQLASTPTPITSLIWSLALIVGLWVAVYPICRWLANRPRRKEGIVSKLAKNLVAFDRHFVAVASRLTGSAVSDPTLRHITVPTVLASYAVVSSLMPSPYGLPIIGVGLVSILAIFRHWSRDDALTLRFTEMNRLAEPDDREIPIRGSLVIDVFLACLFIVVYAAVGFAEVAETGLGFEVKANAATYAYVLHALIEMVKAGSLVDYYDLFKEHLPFDRMAHVVHVGLTAKLAVFCYRLTLNLVLLAVLKRLYDLHKRRREGNDLRPILAGLRSEDEAEQREALRQLRQLASQGRVNAIYALESLIESVADTDPEDKLKLADYLRRIGTKHGGVHALHSVAACLEALRERSDWAPHAAKATERGNWARASALLAATYVAIGERQGSRRRLLEAITLCDEVQAAIGSNPRESATTWEIMQDARALALLGLAKMENDRERIDDAVKLSMDAVKLRGKRPEQLARVYNILGKARMLQSRHQAARDAIVIQQALAAHTTAAKLVRKENNHEVWAETQHLRAKALMANAGLPNFGALLDEAQQCLANATTVWARESSPMDWANVQCDLGLLLHQRARLATKPRETRRLLHDSVMVLTEALKECRAIRGPSDFARVSHSLGNVLVHRGQLDRDKTSIARGTRAIADALASSPRARDLFQWATAQGDRGKAHQVMWKLTSSEADREEAETAYKRALDVWTAKGEPRQFKDITGRLAEVSRQPAKQAA